MNVSLVFEHAVCGFHRLAGAHARKSITCRDLLASFEALQGSSLALIRSARAGRTNEWTRQARHPSNFDLFSCRRGRDVLVEFARERLLEMALREATHDDALAASEWPGDFELVARPNLAMGFRGLTVDIDLAALARFLRFRSRFEQAGDVEPDVEAHFCCSVDDEKVTRARGGDALMVRGKFDRGERPPRDGDAPRLERSDLLDHLAVASREQHIDRAFHPEHVDRV